MNRFFCLLFLNLFLLPVNSHCRSAEDSISLAVSWELMFNASKDSDHARADFTLKNSGKAELNSRNWTLYFNMAPRRIIPAGKEQKADVVHINGDWYKIVPRNNFSLKPGQTCTISYNFQGCMIKESDAPIGLYFVQQDDESSQELIIPIKDYAIRPFVRPEQLFCGGTNDSLMQPVFVQRLVSYSLNQEPSADSLQLQIVPSPVHTIPGTDSTILNSGWTLVTDTGLEEEKNFLVQKLKDYADIDLEKVPVSAAPIIELAFIENESMLPPEGYRLMIQEHRIRIEGDKAGVFYGIQSLLRLIPYVTIKEQSGSVRLPELTIEDYPRFGYRGLHIDVCRNFERKEELLKVIDLMAMYKLNRLHLYLTEDEAWRLEISGLPELTDIGSKRGHTEDETNCLPPAYGSGPFPDPESSYGTGYYSRDDFKEIIRYAWDRHIRVIPSINFPGHARAAIRAMEVRYQKFMKLDEPEKAEEFRLIDPNDHSAYNSAQFYNDNVVCVARESVYHFYETVIDDVIAMYREAGVPLDMVHTGGDEVPEGAWAKSPLCDSLMTTLPQISDPKNLQNYFLERILDILSERGLKAGGWEEVVLTKDQKWQYHVSDRFLDYQVIPYIWNNLEGSEDLGYRIANAGYKVVLCPVTNVYFDLAYDEDPQEPGLYWGGFNSEIDAFDLTPTAMFTDPREMHPGKQFDPAATSDHLVKLEADKEQNIIGLQAQLWHETIRGGKMMEYALLPKLIAFADRCWTPKPMWEQNPKNSTVLNGSRLALLHKIYDEELPKLSLINGGYTYRVPPPTYYWQGGDDELTAVSILPEMQIRYTTDGSDPDENSPLYTTPLKTDAPVRLRCFDRAGRYSRTVTVIPL